MAAIELGSTSLFSDANLVSYYKLENTADSKGANTLTNNGTVAFEAAKFNNGANFGSANTTKYLETLQNFGIAGNGNFSISLWLRAQAEIAAATFPIFTFSSQTTADRYLNLSYEYNAGTRRLTVDNAGNAFSYNLTMGTNDFYHIVVTRTGATASALYVNKVSVGTPTAQGTNAGGSNRLQLARVGGGDYGSWLMDDVAIFSRVLTATEVSLIYDGPSAGGAFLFNFI